MQMRTMPVFCLTTMTAIKTHVLLERQGRKMACLLRPRHSCKSIVMGTIVASIC